MNITTWFAFSIVTLMLFAIISNSSVTGLTNINIQFHKLRCPTPLEQGVDQMTNGTAGLEITYNVDINGNSTTNEQAQVGTFYRCEFDPLSAPPGTSIQTTIKQYKATCFSVIPCGWFGYVGDYLSILGEKIGAFFTLVSYILAPVNFNILGYTIADIGGVGLMLVIGLYIFCYIGIGVFLYKTALPSGGVS